MNRNKRLWMCISASATLIFTLTRSAAAQTTEAPPASAPPPMVLVPAPAQPAPGQPPPAAPAQPGQPYYVQPAQPAQPGQPYYAPAQQPGQPYYGQAPGYAAQPAPPPPKERRPRISRGLMMSGISMLAATYAVGAVSGAILLDVDSCENCDRVGRYLFIPVAGPFVAMNAAEHARSMLALFGLVQTAGAAMMIGGIIKYRRSKQRAEEAGYAFQLPHGRSLAVDMSTSPYRLGPQLSLRF